MPKCVSNCNHACAQNKCKPNCVRPCVCVCVLLHFGGQFNLLLCVCGGIFTKSNSIYAMVCALKCKMLFCSKFFLRCVFITSFFFLLKFLHSNNLGYCVPSTSAATAAAAATSISVVDIACARARAHCACFRIKTIT